MRFLGTAANARLKQTAVNPPGLTLVAPLPIEHHSAVADIVRRVQQARPSFRGFLEKPHLTLQGVMADRQSPLTPAGRDQVVAVSAAVLREVFAGHPPIALELATIEPGGRPDAPVADLVWVASPASKAAIAALAVRINVELRERLPAAVAAGLGGLVGSPGGPGVKITLGYFDEPDDFAPEGALEAALTGLAHQRLTFTMRRAELCEFTFKSLAGARVLHPVDLAS